MSKEKKTIYTNIKSYILLKVIPGTVVRFIDITCIRCSLLHYKTDAGYLISLQGAKRETIQVLYFQRVVFVI